MDLDPIIYSVGSIIFLIALALIPSKESRILKKAFDKPIKKLDKSLDGKCCRVQGKVTPIKTTITPFFKQQAVFHDSGFYTLKEREKRDPDFHSYEFNWNLEKSEKVKNNFLLEDNGWYALIKVDNSIEILNKTKNDINQYDISFISSLNSSSMKFEDIKANLNSFMDKFEITKLSQKNYFHYEVLRVKEQLLKDGDFVSIVGKCSLESIDNHPELKGIVHPMTEELLVIESSDKPLYLTDDMKTLYG